METEKIKQLQQWVDQSDRIVFFGGAGVSTESGIPDYRSQDGLYHQQYDVPPAYRGVLPLLPEQNDLSDGEAQCGTQEAGGDGTGRKTAGSSYPEH